MKAIYPPWVKVLALTPFLATGCDNGTSNFVETEMENPEEYVESSITGDSIRDGEKIASDRDPDVLKDIIGTGPNDLTPGDKAEILDKINGEGEGEGGSGGGASDDDGYSTSGSSGKGGSGKWSGKGTAKFPPELALAHWTFDSAVLRDGEVNFYPDGGNLVQSLQMESNRQAASLTFEQVSRPVVTELFAQGSENKSELENFNQNSSASGLLDLLIVVDNSGSMVEEQKNLSTKLSPLLSYVSNSDWRIGVVTTDPQDGCLRGLIKKGDQNAQSLFSQAVQPGTKGSGNERGIYQAVQGLKGECNQNGSWLRSNSAVAVLIVSDEDNCSDGKGCGNDPWKNGSYLTNYLSSIRQLGVNSRVYGLVGHPSQSSQQCKTALNKGHIYADVIDDSNGTWGSICDNDYTQTLQSISHNLSVILLSQFTLKYNPFPASVKVKVNGVLQSSGYTVNGNVVEFANPPAAGSQIEIAYDFVSTAPSKEFALKQEADAATLDVYLDGVQTENYSYSSGKIAFSDAPMAYEIKAVYKPGDMLEKDFAIGSQAAADSIEVTVGDKKLASNEFSYDASQGLVRLNAAPAEGASIKVDFANQTVPRLSYPIYTGVAAGTSVSVTDQKSGDAVGFQMENGQITFPADEFAALRMIEVAFFLGNHSWTVDLGYAVESGSVRAEGSNGIICTNISSNGSEINLDSCGFAADESVTIAFRYSLEQALAYDLGSAAVDGNWEVKVNGQDVTDFTIASGMLTFPDLPENAKIEVTLYKKN